MCTSRPKAPEVIYQGPSQEEIDAQNQQLEMARQQMEQSNQRLQSQLDQQIAAANTESERFRASLAEQTAAKAAESAPAQTYTTTTTTAAPLVGTAMTTEPIKPKKKPSAGLTITPAGVAAAAGAGLNIGT